MTDPKAEPLAPVPPLAEPLPPGRAVHLGGLVERARDVLQPGEKEHPSFSPDATSVAFIRDNKMNWVMFLVFINVIFFIAGLGTSGTLMGVGRYLKEREAYRKAAQDSGFKGQIIVAKDLASLRLPSK